MSLDLEEMSDPSTSTPTARRAVKVCHFTTSHLALDNRLFDKEARSLARAGYEVTIVGPHEREECREGIRLVPIPRPAGRLGRLRMATWRILRLALNENADVYHFHDPELIPAALFLKLRGKRVIYDVHEDYEQTALGAAWIPRGLRRIVSLAWGALERTAGRLFDYVVVVDSHIRRKFPPHKTELITNVPPLSFARSQPKPARSGPLRIVYTGGVAERRGVFRVVEALGHLRSPDVELHLIGQIDEPEHRKTLQSHPQIICHGRLPWRQMRDALEAADVGLMLFQPTPEHMVFTGEGNTKLFEFMGLGIPVLYADLPNLRKFMETTGGGIPVDPTCPKKIAEAIDLLHDDPALCRTLGENGRKAVRERYHWEKEERKLLDVYERVAPRGAARI